MSAGRRSLLNRHGEFWVGLATGARAGHQYMFFVEGQLPEAQARPVRTRAHQEPGARWPGGGTWREIFNSDAYDYQPTGNSGSVDAWLDGGHALPARVGLTIPANSVLISSR